MAPPASSEDEGDELSEVLLSNGVCGSLCQHLAQEVHEIVTTMVSDHHLAPPSVSLLLVGRHPAALSYASSTLAAARAAGVVLRVQRLPETATHEDVAQCITAANADWSCHGVVLQLPLPAHLNAAQLLGGIADDKDVDCLKEGSVRRCLLRVDPTVSPCIAAAVEEVLRSLELLKPASASAARARGGGRAAPHVLLLGVPPLLAFPLELWLEAAGCHVSRLADQEPAESARACLQRADVLLVGARRPDLVAAQWVRSGCVILDLGLATTIPAPAPAASTTAASADGVAGGGSGGAEDAPAVRDVLCLCCSDGLSGMTAALRVRNASHAALVQQGFLEQDKPGHALGVDGTTEQVAHPFGAPYWHSPSDGS